MEVSRRTDESEDEVKLKTALELLGHVGDDDVDCDDPGCKMCRECEHHEPCNCMIDELVRRAREEAFEMVANHCRIMVSVSGTREAAALTAIADDVTRWTKAAP
jgi:hypothetical protein